MENILYILIAIIAFATYKGLYDLGFRERYIFNTDSILIRKEYYRLLTSGFLHGSWFHFLFNMLALESFGKHLLYELGLTPTALLYTACLMGGSLLSLFIHRNHGDYSALGASGAVSGLVLASIAIAPYSSVSFFIIPFSFTAWHVGLVFLAISIIGIKRAADNIGHDAHLGGAITGLVLAALLMPDAVKNNVWVYLLMIIPALGFVAFIIKYPSYLMHQDIAVRDYLPKSSFGKKQLNKEQELDRLLNKISSNGLQSLTKKERAQLEALTGR